MHFLVDGGYSESLVLLTTPGLSIHFPLKTVETCSLLEWQLALQTEFTDVNSESWFSLLR